MPDELKLLEREVEKILNDCASDLRSWNELDANHRWSKINSSTKAAETKVIDAIRRAWRVGREGV